jgi:hypothetical protein
MAAAHQRGVLVQGILAMANKDERVRDAISHSVDALLKATEFLLNLN